MNICFFLFEQFCRFILKFYCPLTVFGKENLPEGKFIIASNHQSHMDSAMLMVATCESFKIVGLIAAKDYFFDAWHRRIVRYFLNLIPISRGKGPKAIDETAKFCSNFLDNGGKILIIYPEGTRTLDGSIGLFKPGPAILSHKLNLPIVPARVEGSFKAFPKGSFFMKPAKVSVSFGKPINILDFLDQSDQRKDVFEAYRKAILEIEKKVKDL